MYLTFKWFRKKPIKYTHINMDRKYKENTEEKQEFIS